EGWLAAGRQQGVWPTVEDGSPASVWFTLAAWWAGAELIALEEPVPSREQVELLARLRPAAVWFEDDAYAELAPEGKAAAFAAGSIGRVLANGTGEGAAAFADAFGAPVAPVPELDEKGASLVPVLDETEGGDEPDDPDRWLAADQALR